jgi:hypothetical protein
MTTEELLDTLASRVRAAAERLLSEDRFAEAAEMASLLDRIQRARPVLLGANEAASHTKSRGVRQDIHLAPTSHRAPGPLREDYPWFCRDADDLVKIGWSARKDEEYVHRAPRASVDAVAYAIPAAAKNSRFKRDDLEGVGAMDDGRRTVPDYQVYLCLGWLRWAGLIRQLGRGEYTIPDLTRFQALVEGAWKQLPLIQDATHD